ncbi:MAG TPA: hypothetical protein ENI33_00425 [Thermoplasmatales archaeon]|nr:hypothetical protein [Thermoplasmatales archaeon]
MNKEKIKNKYFGVRIVSICIILMMLAINFQEGVSEGKNEEDGEVLKVCYNEKIDILENGEANISLSISILSPTLAQFYKTALGIKNAVPGKKIDIPPHAIMPAELEICEGVSIKNLTAIKTTIPTRNEILSSFIEEQKNSFGLIVTDLYEAKAKACSNGTCQIYLKARAILQIANVTRYGNEYKWEIVIGQANASMAGNATGFTLGKVVFIKYMLDAIPGKQEYEQNWATKISLPDGAEILDHTNKSWIKEFGGNTNMQTHLTEKENSIFLNETMKVDESDIDEMDNISTEFIGYKTFRINCSISCPTEKTLDENDRLIKWSWTWKWKWSVKLLDIDLSWNYTDTNYAIYAKANSKVKVSGYLGWKLKGELIPPSVKLKWFEMWIMPELSANIEIDASASINWSKIWTKTLYTYSTTYVIWIGFIPVVIDVNLKVYSKIDVGLSAQINVTAGARYFSSTKLGLRYSHGWHDINEKIVDKGYTFNITQCKFFAKFKPSLNARLEALLYGLAGPFIEVGVFLLATLNITKSVTVAFNLELGAGVYVGVTFHSILKKLLKLHDYSWPLWEWKVKLWDGTWSIGNVSVDHTPPSTIRKYQMPYWTDGSTDTITTRTNITLEAKDDNSGVKETWYRIDNSSWKKYNAPFKIHIPGNHNISYYSIDKNNNTEQVKVQNVTVIMTEPESVKIVGEPNYDVYVNASTPITLTSYYPLPWKIKWRVGYNGSWSNWNETDWNTDAIFNFSEECAHCLEWYAFDYLGNEEEHHIQSHLVDCIPPSITLMNPLLYCKMDNSTGCIEKLANITLFVIDTATNASCISGIMGIYWGFWLNGTWHPVDEKDTYDNNPVLYFEVENKSWYLYNASKGIRFFEECKHTVEYWATDNVWNRGRTLNHTYYVDSTYPVITVSIGNPKWAISSNTYYVKTSTPITINAYDLGCCPNLTVEYRMKYNNSWEFNWTEIDTLPFIFNFSKECKHDVYIRAYDCLNHTTYENITFYVDDTSPDSWLTTEIKYWKRYATSLTEFTIWAADYGCECGSYIIHYSINGPENAKFYLNGEYHDADGTWYKGMRNQPVAFQIRDENGFAPEGTYIVKYWAEDDLGTPEEEIHTQVFYVENECPETYIRFEGEIYKKWICSNTSIILNASDKGSGVMETLYAIDNGSKNIYKGAFKIKEEGKHTISFYSIDYLGHKENEKVCEVYIDNIPPETQIKIEGEEKWITSSDIISIKGTDKGCGVYATYYRIDNEKWNIVTGDIRIKEEGKHLLEFYSVDNLNNREETKRIEIYIDNSPPEIKFISPKLHYLYIFGREIVSLSFIKADTIIIGSIEIKINAVDLCPIKKIVLYIDGEKVKEIETDVISYVWDEKSFSGHEIEVIAYDSLHQMSMKELRVIMFNIR